MSEPPETEQISTSDVKDGDRLLLGDGLILQVGDYITWQDDEVHIEGAVDGEPRELVLDRAQSVHRLK